MRAYRKTTHHPLCVYLTEAEAVAVVADVEDLRSAITEYDMPLTPELNSLVNRLGVLLGNPKRERA